MAAMPAIEVGLAVGLGLAVALCMVGSAWLGVRLVRWARKNRARAAERMLGTYLGDAVVPPPDGDDADALDSFSDWLGAKVDALSGESGAADPAHVSDAWSDDSSGNTASDAGYGAGD